MGHKRLSDTRHFCEFSANVALVRSSADRSCASLSRVRQKELVQASRIPARARDVHQMGRLGPNWAERVLGMPADGQSGTKLGRFWADSAHHTHRLGANWEESGKNLHVTHSGRDPAGRDPCRVLHLNVAGARRTDVSRRRRARRKRLRGRCPERTRSESNSDDVAHGGSPR